MTREDTKKILDKVLDMGQSPMHYVGLGFSTDKAGVFCEIFIHLDTPTSRSEHRCICDCKFVYNQSDDVQPVLEWLDVWAEIFRKERELDETDGH